MSDQISKRFGGSRPVKQAQAPLVAEAHQELHEQNLRDLELIRTDPAWALSMVQKARELARQLEQTEQRESKQFRQLEEAARKVEQAEREKERLEGQLSQAADVNALLTETERLDTARYRKALERIADWHEPNTATGPAQVATQALSEQNTKPSGEVGEEA